MAWRSVLISQPARLSLRHQQLHLVQESGLEVDVPLEDISVVILETPQALITTALLAALAEAGVAVLTCDDSHHPNGVLLPYLPHSRQTRVLHKQLALTEPQKKRAWQRVVSQKLRNQAAVLAGHKADGVALLQRLASKVRSGDPDNFEGQGARCYFASLFGSDFTRADEDWVNCAMNYGYAIVRAALARSVTSYGLLPALGLHHNNQLNAFNLVDDLIEPFRAVVDQHVLQLSCRQLGLKTGYPLGVSHTLLPAHKAELIQLLYVNVGMPAGQMTTLAATEQCALSMGRLVEANDYQLLELPVLLE